MKKLMACVAVFVLLITIFAPVIGFATDVEKIENKGKPKIELRCDKGIKEDEILIVTVSLSGCEGLTSADLKFEYNPKVLTFLGGSVLGAAAADNEFYSVLSSEAHIEANGWGGKLGRVSLSFMHINNLSAEEGNGDIYELAFKTGRGRSSIKTIVETFCIKEQETEVSRGKCSYFSGISSYFKNKASSVLVCAVIFVVVVVLIVLLVVIKNMKKKVPVEGFENTDNSGTEGEAPPQIEDSTAQEEPEESEQADVDSENSDYENPENQIEDDKETE